MRQLDGITYSVDMILSQLWEKGSLACCSSWGHKESDLPEGLNSTDNIFSDILRYILPLVTYIAQGRVMASAFSDCF